MKKFLLASLLINIAPNALSQTPLSSRLYLNEDGKVFRYEANLRSYELKDSEKGIKSLDVLGTDESCTNDNNGCAEAKIKIPQGFGNLALTSFSGGTEARINLVRYNLNYSTNGYLPIYLLVNPTTDVEFTRETLNNSLLGTDTGLVNFKIADDTYTFKQNDGNGVCDFRDEDTKNLHGGCYVNLQAGVKLLNYKSPQDENKRTAAFYSSAQFAFEFPITEPTNLTKTGRLIGTFGLSGYYANTAKASSLFPELTENQSKLNKAYASFDAGINLVIDDQFSVTATFSHPLNNKELLDSVTSVSFTWTPK